MPSDFGNYEDRLPVKQSCFKEKNVNPFKILLTDNSTVVAYFLAENCGDCKEDYFTESTISGVVAVVDGPKIGAITAEPIRIIISSDIDNFSVEADRRFSSTPPPQICFHKPTLG